MRKGVKTIEDIANKNRKMVKEWKIKNPECASSKSFTPFLILNAHFYIIMKLI